MVSQFANRPYSQRQLRVGELVKQNLGELFIRNEAKIPSLNSNKKYQASLFTRLKVAFSPPNCCDTKIHKLSIKRLYS